MTSVDVRCREPFSLDLSLRAMRSFGRTATSSEAASLVAPLAPYRLALSPSGVCRTDRPGEKKRTGGETS